MADQEEQGYIEESECPLVVPVQWWCEGSINSQRFPDNIMHCTRIDGQYLVNPETSSLWVSASYIYASSVSQSLPELILLTSSWVHLYQVQRAIGPTLAP